MKEIVIRLLFDFFRSYMSPKDAVIATLGGWGLEATLWKEFEVQKENGWLIERNIDRRKVLIPNFPFHNVNQLGSFPRLFRSVKGEGVGVDFFHLDLCGTLEASYELIHQVLPLVLVSKGKCLAVTVADQRRNRSHENFKPVFIEGKKLFGKPVAEELLRHLKLEGAELATHLEGDVHDEGIARREYGFFVHLAKVLGDTKIERMERYVYHSEVGARSASFRMRTYMFHLEHGELNPMDWVRNPIQLVLPTGCVIVNNQFINRSETEKKGSSMKFNEKLYPALSGMLVHASDEVRADFGRLMESFGSSDELAGELATVLAKHGFGSRSKRIAKPSEVVTPLPFPGERWGTTDKEVAVKLFLLESKAGCDSEAFDKAREVAATYLGISDDNKKNRNLGAHLARTKGEKFRPLFMKSVFESTPPENHEKVISDLAKCYTSLGCETNVQNLQEEAVQAGYIAA